MKASTKRWMSLLLCMLLALGACPVALAQDPGLDLPVGSESDRENGNAILTSEEDIAKMLQQLVVTMKNTTSDTWIEDLRKLSKLIENNEVAVTQWLGKHGNGIDGAEIGTILNTLMRRPGDTTYMHGNKQYVISNMLEKAVDHYSTKSTEMLKQVLSIPCNKGFARYIPEQPGEGDVYTINSFQYVPFINNTSGNIMINNQTVRAVMQAELIKKKEGDDVAEHLSILRNHLKVEGEIAAKIKVPSVGMEALDGFVMTLAKNGKDIMEITTNIYLSSDPVPQEVTLILDGPPEELD